MYMSSVWYVLVWICICRHRTSCKLLAIYKPKWKGYDLTYTNNTKTDIFQNKSIALRILCNPKSSVVL